MDKQQVMQIIETGLKAARQKLLEEAEIAQPIFEVRPIGNGFVVQYNDIEQYDKQVVDYSQMNPTHGGRALGTPPQMRTVRRFRFKRAEVYCADAAAIKVAVDDALRLDEKVKLAAAEGVLSDSGDADLAVGT